jgi:hypothetical protein
MPFLSSAKHAGPEEEKNNTNIYTSLVLLISTKAMK